MITIDFYSTFEKKTNSTKKPSGTAALSLDGNLIHPCSVLHPVVQIKRLAADACPEVYIYAVIPAFNRYYFVRDWVWMDGLWEVRLDCDILASWKTYIGELNEYILRTDSTNNSNDYDPYIIDTLYPVTREPDIHKTLLNAGWTNKTPSEGCYVVGIISGSSSTVTGSAVTYYAMTISQLAHLVDYLLSDQFINDAGFTTSPLNTEPISHNVAKSLLNPLQYIVSCMWVPKSASSIGESSPRQIQVGYYSIATTIAQGYWMPDTVTSFSFTCDPPEHPDSASKGLYLNYAPYTQATCFLPPFGQFPINLQCMRAGFKLRFECNLDLVTGKANLRIYKHDPDNLSDWLIQETSAMMGVPIQLAQVANDLIKSATSFISAAGGAAGAIGHGLTGNYIGATYAGLSSLNSIGNAIESLFPQAVSEGANGSFSSFRQTGWLIINYRYQVAEDIVHRGRPLCENRTIKNLSGFILCAEGDHDIPCMLEEKESISKYLTEGFFWE